MSGRKPVHGDTDTPLHNVWMSMLARCRLSTDTNYPNYGARGIVVCGEWHDYVVFKAWAMGAGYTAGLSIDRLDVNGDYSPDNCRWATRTQQARNTRNSHKVTAFGETKTVAEWAEDARCSISYNGILYRLRKGWSPEEAIATTRTQTGGPP